MALGSIAVSATLAPRVWPRMDITGRGMAMFTVVFALFPFLRTDFGQREHFAVILTLPYVLMAAIEQPFAWQRRGSRVLIGIAAGIGFALKPHFAVAWALIEAYVWMTTWRERPWRRPEFLAAIAVGVAYAVWILVFVPEYLSVAREAWQLYSGQGATMGTLVRLPDVSVWLLGAALLVFLKLSRDARRPAITLFVAATGFLIAGLLQRKGWAYQLYPFRAFAMLAFTAMTLALFETLPSLATALRGGLNNIALLLTAVLVASSVRYQLEARHPPSPDLVTPLVNLINTEAPRGPIAVLSMRTVIYPAFPAVNEAHAVWSMRQNALWYLQGLYADELLLPDAETRFRAPDQMPQIERQLFDETISDLCARPPALLLIEPPIPRAAVGRRSLDLAAYYDQDSRFRSLFTAYSPLTTIGTFTVFKSNGSASCAAR